MALGDAKSGRDVDSTLRPDSRLAFRRPRRQTHGAHRTQGIIFADVGVDGCGWSILIFLFFVVLGESASRGYRSTLPVKRTGEYLIAGKDGLGSTAWFAG